MIGLFFLLVYHLTKTALETTDPFNTYICVGIISLITFHVFQNIGMTIQVLPITGIPLPFISYGGSSLMGNMFAMGLIYSIHYHHRNYMFSSNRSYSDTKVQNEIFNYICDYSKSLAQIKGYILYI